MEENWKRKRPKAYRHSNTADIDLTLSVVTLNVNGLKCKKSPHEVV